jgi:hypothetical protein
MTTRIASTNIQSNTILTTNLAPSTVSALQGSTVPTITQIQVTTSAYVVKDDTAVSTSGGYIKITGTNFTAGSQVVIGSTPATSVGFVNSTTLNVQVPALAAGTYVVYVTINTGSVAIIVNGLTYSGDPTWVTGSTLTPNQVDSLISIQLSATGDAPITYSLQAGSSLPAGLTLTSGGLLSGTITGISVETTYNFTIEAIDAQAQESPRTFSITITANDQNFEYVTTLLSAANPASTFVTDASTNNLAVTVNGDTRPTGFGPYTPGYYSAFFDGTGDYLTVPYNTTAFNWWTSNYTLEAWIYPTTLTGWYYLDGAVNKGTIVGNNAFNSASNYWSLGLNSSGNLWFAYYTGANQGAGTSNTVTLNTWNHIALVVNGTNITLYLNGVGTSLGNIVGTPLSGTELPLTIGAGNNSYVNGYISNLRIVKGTAVYTSNFTPPTAPLTAIANTSLLICQSNRFIDTSTNAYTVTRNGDTSISGFDPFAPNSSYNGYGSGYFDGTGDYLSAAANAAFQFGTGDFTIECWINKPSAANGSVADARATATAIPWALYVDASNFPYFYDGTVYTSSVAIVNNSWNHIAVSRSNGTLRIFVNGVQGYSASHAVSLNATGPLLVGGTAAYTTGYICDLRIVKGSAVYTSAFTPPTAPLTAIANTQLLTLQNNQPNNNNMFLDSSTNNFNITRNGNATQGSFSPYGGGWSNYFDGSGDTLTVAANSALDLTGDFTIEFWANMQGDNNYICNGTQQGSGTWRFRCDASTGTVLFDMAIGSWAGLNLYSTSSQFTKNTWYHFAVTRSGSSFKLFINGVTKATATNSGSLTNTGRDTQIGYYVEGSGTYYSQWYLSNLRIVKGTAVYTSDFTPPTAPLTPIAGTSLLTCADNRFIDDSANNFTITRNGDVSVQRFNPFNPILTTPTSYSGYFDGNGDYLTLVSAAGLGVQSANFTLELWAYFNAATATNDQPFYANLTSSGYIANTFWFGKHSAASGKVTVYIYNYSSSTYLMTEPSLPPANQWVHYALVRNGNTFTIYRDGVATVSSTFSGAVTGSTSPAWIGRSGDGSDANSFNGYMSNLRLVNGTAVYTSAFTPPTSPLTAIANTSLLTLQNATFIDNSTNNFAITANGGAAPRQFNPFGWSNTLRGSAAYSAANYGGGMYFDGTGDYLALSLTGGIGSGDFTVEYWVYYTSFYDYITNVSAYRGSTGWNCGTQSAGQIVWYSSGAEKVRGSTAMRANSWNHVVFVRSSGTLKGYLNGVQDGTTSTETTNFTSSDINIGRLQAATPGENFTGYMSNVRIVRGQALYTSNFAPPVSPLSFNSNTTLLVNGTGAAIYDSSMMATYETVGNTTSTGVIKKYGNSSMSFDGTGDYLVSPFSVNNNLGTGSFTFEAWLYPSSIAGIRGFYALTGGSGGVPKFVIHLNAGTPSIHYNGLTGGSDIYTTATSAITANTWTHLAFVRNGSTWTWYINGVASGTGSNSTNITFTTQPLYVGYGGESYFTEFNGYIDDLRVTRGVARYTANFTPPSSPVIQF